MNPAEAKKSVPGILAKALAKDVRFPAHWLDDEEKKELKKTILTQLLSCHKEDGSGYDEGMCMAQLVERYGVKEAQASPTKGKKRNAADADADETEGDGSPKKAKKKETMACEENRAAAMVLQEISDLYWKNKDNFKGATFSKAAKALRECETYCSSSKEACKLKGIGKGCGAIIEEVLKTGKCDKLEKMRAGEM